MQSIYLLNPLTDPAKAWVKDHVSENHQTFGGRIVIEHRYVDEIYHGLVSAGLKLGIDFQIT